MTAQRKKLIIVSAAFFVVLATAWFVLWRDPGTSAPAAQTQSAQSKPASNDVVVYVSGGIFKPGVYKMNANARVIDAVNAAGGLAIGANPAGINMAQLCTDGMHINVPMRLTQSNTVSPSVNPNGTPAMAYSPDISLNNAKVSINSASATELATLPGIGDALAQRIVDYRNKNGGFSSVEDIRKVSGVGDARFNKIKDQITL